jgi:hypothetical protein
VPPPRRLRPCWACPRRWTEPCCSTAPAPPLSTTARRAAGRRAGRPAHRNGLRPGGRCRQRCRGGPHLRGQGPPERPSADRACRRHRRRRAGDGPFRVRGTRLGRGAGPTVLARPADADPATAPGCGRRRGRRAGIDRPALPGAPGGAGAAACLSGARRDGAGCPQCQPVRPREPDDRRPCGRRVRRGAAHPGRRPLRHRHRVHDHRLHARRAGAAASGRDHHRPGAGGHRPDGAFRRGGRTGGGGPTRFRHAGGPLRPARAGAPDGSACIADRAGRAGQRDPRGRPGDRHLCARGAALALLRGIAPAHARRRRQHRAATLCSAARF